MTGAEDRLARLFAQDEPPARDPAFLARVMEGVARRRLRRDLARAAALASVSAVALWGAAPFLAEAARLLPVGSELFTLGVAAASGVALSLLAFPGLRGQA